MARGPCFCWWGGSYNWSTAFIGGVNEFGHETGLVSPQKFLEGRRQGLALQPQPRKEWFKDGLGEFHCPKQLGRMHCAQTHCTERKRRIVPKLRACNVRAFCGRCRWCLTPHTLATLQPLDVWRVTREDSDAATRRCATPGFPC